MAPFLDERGRRLFTASEARAAGRGGVTAVATATRVARSTIGRGLAELRRGRDDLGRRIRRPGGGRNPAVDASRRWTQAGGGGKPGGGRRRGGDEGRGWRQAGGGRKPAVDASRRWTQPGGGRKPAVDAT